MNEFFVRLAGEDYRLPSEKLQSLGDLLGAELMDAASKTKSVTGPAAFLLTRLRRRLGVRAVTIETE